MYDKPLAEVLKELDSSKKGLTEEEAKKRIETYGYNQIQEGKKISPIKIFFAQFHSVVIYILLAALIISVFLDETVDAIVIGIILILNAIIGFVQEYRAEKSIEALKKMASLKATVLRNGNVEDIEARLLVPGDIILLETGNKIPADSRLIEIVNLETQEAALTGESTPVVKEIMVVAPKTPLAEQRNMVFSGTIVTRGKAHAIVTGTGMKSQIGKIAQMIEETETELTPLQKKMNELGRVLGIITIFVAIAVFGIGFLNNADLFTQFKIAVALAVAAVPEGLPVVVTVGLAIGVKRMVKRNALVRKLPSVETLGSTTVICTDKTGTLTKNEMTVRRLYVNNKIFEVTGSGYNAKGSFLFNNKKVNPKEIELLLKIGILNNDAAINGSEVVGDPTEAALLVSAAKANFNYKKIQNQIKRLDEIPFTSERKIMTTIHSINGKKTSYVKGAPEILLQKCTKIIENNKVKKLTPQKKKEILEINKKFANKALRVLGFAYGDLKNKKDAEKNLVFVGLQGMIDPPRDEVKTAIAKCKNAGIRVIVITGDNGLTAKAIAHEIGIEGELLTGQELENMTQKDLEKSVEKISIYARVNPEHKIKIIAALKKKGHIAAMTGDGVNDAPALKKADIGISMGMAGTDVAKEASDMILTDDNFASIVNAVEEGRGVYGNIRKYFSYLISGNIGEVLIILLGMVFWREAALTATQILLINLVTDGLPAVALSTDPYEPNSMSRKPRKQSEPIYAGLRPFLLYYPAALTIVALSVFSFFYDGTKDSLPLAQTATFLTIGMFELYQAFACRSTLYPAFRVGIFKNKWLILAVASSFIVMLFAIFMDGLNVYLDMVPLQLGHFLAIIALSSIGAIIIELGKWVKTRNEPIMI